MRILFIGTVEFSWHALKKLIDLNANVVGVCTKESSNFNTDFKSLVPLCVESDIPYKLANDINSDDTIAWIKEKRPDIIFCFGWSSLIKKRLLDTPSMGVVGFHPAALPRNRGRHPLIWALALGLEETASTFFFMDEGADSGDILSQQKIVISYRDNARSLYEKVVNTAIGQVELFYDQLLNRQYAREKQNHALATYWRKRDRSDGQIDFRMTSRAIYNLVRALSEPYVGAHLVYNNNDVKIWEVEEVEFSDCNYEPGLILGNDNGICVKTYDGAIKLVRHEFLSLPEKGSYL